MQKFGPCNTKTFSNFRRKSGFCNTNTFRKVFPVPEIISGTTVHMLGTILHMISFPFSSLSLDHNVRMICQMFQCCYLSVNLWHLKWHPICHSQLSLAFNKEHKKQQIFFSTKTVLNSCFQAVIVIVD